MYTVAAKEKKTGVFHVWEGFPTSADAEHFVRKGRPRLYMAHKWSVVIVGEAGEVEEILQAVNKAKEVA